MYIIKEKIYGNMATVFHRTSVSDLANKVYTEGFKPGGGDMYGKGFYATYELESQQRNEMKKYGDIIVKFAVPIENFFIFDYEEFVKSPQYKKLGRLSIENFLQAQFDHFKMTGIKEDFFEIKNIDYTSDLALSYYHNIPNFTKLCQGIIFTGQRDGHVLVAYDTSILMPLSYSKNNGKTFKSVEKNDDYLKKVSSKQITKFDPNLKIKPEDFGITKYKYIKDGFLDVFEDVDLSDKGLTTIPFNFGHVHGNFNCSSSSLTSLKGSPRIVEGTFDCSNNRLTSLKDGPETVKGNYLCYESNLKSLIGSPKEVGGTFDCNDNMLTTLEGGPKIVKNKFDCSYNGLTTLEGGPQKVGKEYECVYNDLVSLLGAPSLILGLFNCESNNLTSLEYCPKAKSIGYRNNPGDFSKEEIEKYLIH
jgi:hypothetical protein